MQIILNCGEMPNTDFTYEAFEAFLASFYLSFEHMKDSPDKSKKEKFVELELILDALAAKYGVQKPSDVAQNAQARNGWVKPEKITNYLALLGSYADFVMGYGIKEPSELLQFVDSNQFDFKFKTN